MRTCVRRYDWDGEPAITAVTREYVGCLDYILYSGEKLEPVRVPFSCFVFYSRLAVFLKADLQQEQQNTKQVAITKIPQKKC